MSESVVPVISYPSFNELPDILQHEFKKYSEDHLYLKLMIVKYKHTQIEIRPETFDNHYQVYAIGDYDSFFIFHLPVLHELPNESKVNINTFEIDDLRIILESQEVQERIRVGAGT